MVVISLSTIMPSSRVRSAWKIVARCSSNNATLPGGFNADGLRELAVLTNFGTDDFDTLTGQEIRRRKRHMDDDIQKQPYVDLFSKRVSNEIAAYLADHPSPTDVLGRAFFGSKQFTGEKMVLSSLNTMFSLYPEGATALPAQFNLNDRYLHWNVSMKAPLELICSYQIDALNFRGFTMLAFDPSLRKAYHGNCIDVTENRIQSSQLAQWGVKLHVRYAEMLLDGMVGELDKIIKEN